MRKLFVFLFIFVAVLCGCGGKPVSYTHFDGENKIIIVADNSVCSIDKNTTLADYIVKIKEIEVVAQNGDYGMFITAINGIENKVTASSANSSEGYSWNIYIDFITLEGDNALYASDSSTYEYDGKTLYMASYGASAIPCVAGHTYALLYEYYNYTW